MKLILISSLSINLVKAYTYLKKFLFDRLPFKKKFPESPCKAGLKHFELNSSFHLYVSKFILMNMFPIETFEKPQEDPTFSTRGRPFF